MQADTAETRARFPFGYRLVFNYELRDSDLVITLAIANPNDEVLPCSIGGHPALNWPLSPGLSKASYRLTFSHDEPAPIRRLSKQGLLLPEPRPSPIRGRVLDLSERLFDEEGPRLPRCAKNCEFHCESFLCDQFADVDANPCRTIFPVTPPR